MFWTLAAIVYAFLILCIFLCRAIRRRKKHRDIIHEVWKDADDAVHIRECMQRFADNMNRAGLGHIINTETERAEDRLYLRVVEFLKDHPSAYVTAKHAQAIGRDVHITVALRDKGDEYTITEIIRPER